MLSYQRVLLVQDGAPSRAKAFRNALQVAEVYGKNGRYNERVHSSLIVKTNHPEHGDESQKTWEKSEKSQKKTGIFGYGDDSIAKTSRLHLAMKCWGMSPGNFTGMIPYSVQLT